MRISATRIGLFMALLLLTSTLVWAQYGGGAGGQQPATPNSVNIQGFAFNPPELTVSVGTKVTWTNLDSTTHTVTSRSGLFDTGNLGRSQQGFFTFDKAGSYDYFCKIHPSMEGKIIVTGSQAAQATTKFGANITREQEVPAPAALTSGQSSASAMGFFELNADETELSYNITYTTMTGNVAAIHFHKEKAGVAGGVVRPICAGNCPSGTSSFVVGAWKSTDAQPLTPDLVKALKAGEIYVNLHTSANVGGEIRGQLAPASFIAFLNRDQEVPAPKALDANQTPGYGTAFFQLNDAGTELTYNVTYTTMSGPISAMHFHRAKAGVAGGVIRLICGGGTACPSGTGGTVTGVWKSTDAQPLTPDFVKALKDGELYVNLHTAANPGGEIRGQLK
ncbi:CHRD domain-containing protein [Candidatus Acetothermia bacterium]|nr:CHRD domain-containing protein [Candidatus Acetothermia bacterium]